MTRGAGGVALSAAARREAFSNRHTKRDVRWGISSVQNAHTPHIHSASGDLRAAVHVHAAPQKFKRNGLCRQSSSHLHDDGQPIVAQNIDMIMEAYPSM